MGWSYDRSPYSRSHRPIYTLYSEVVGDTIQMFEEWQAVGLAGMLNIDPVFGDYNKNTP